MLSLSGENGLALPLVLGALALGVVVIAPFLAHASASLVSAGNYRQMLYEQYSADAGVEQAIWRLSEDGLAAELEVVADTTTYTLESTVNGISPVITVVKTEKGGQEYFRIDSLAGSTSITAEVLIEDGEAQIESWEVKK